MKVSELSFGASSLGGVFHSVKESDAIQAVFTAIEKGMNLRVPKRLNLAMKQIEDIFM